MPYILTLVADRSATTLTRPTIEIVREALGGTRAPVILSEGEAADLPCPAAPDLAVLRGVLQGAPIDALVTRARGRRRAVLVADMDSTIVTGETLDDLAALAGLGEKIASITRRSMNGELDFREALRERVAMLRGFPVGLLEQTFANVKLTLGAKTLVATMRHFGAATALVSGGFSFFTERVASLCGFAHHRANILLDDGKTLTGRVQEPILDRDTKLAALREFAALRGARMQATLAVGDGANDLAMLREAGLGVAFHARPVVAAEIANRVDHADLRALLFAQGYPASVFRDA